MEERITLPATIKLNSYFYLTQDHKLEVSRISFKIINFKPIHYITKIAAKIGKNKI